MALKERLKAYLDFLRHNRNVSPHTLRAYATGTSTAFAKRRTESR